MVKARKKQLDKGTEARRLARKVASLPATTRGIPDKRKRPPKHQKKELLDIE